MTIRDTAGDIFMFDTTSDFAQLNELCRVQTITQGLSREVVAMRKALQEAKHREQNWRFMLACILEEHGGTMNLSNARTSAFLERVKVTGFSTTLEIDTEGNVLLILHEGDGSDDDHGTYCVNVG